MARLIQWIAACCSAVVICVAGCSGPQSLTTAMRPVDEQAYQNAISNNKHPRDAFFEMKAQRDGATASAIRQADEQLDTGKNPFNARQDAEAVSLGAVVYKNHCIQCHGEHADGRGPQMPVVTPNMDFHDFSHRFAITLHNGAPRSWYQKISEGYTSETPGPDSKPLAMPAFKDVLAREQIWLAITYLQSIDATASASVKE